MTIYTQVYECVDERQIPEWRRLGGPAVIWPANNWKGVMINAYRRSMKFPDADEFLECDIYDDDDPESFVVDEKTGVVRITTEEGLITLTPMTLDLYNRRIGMMISTHQVPEKPFESDEELRQFWFKALRNG